jgi:hypothetical protein
MYLSSSNNPQAGRWFRFFNGETANVKMWGARGNGADNDTVAIQNAINAVQTWGYVINTSQELYIPTGVYLVTNTIDFSSYLHIRGDSAFNTTTIRMQGDKDVFRTINAKRGLQNEANDWDHALIFENMAIECGADSVSNAALVVCLPGETTVIRNIRCVQGGYGIRCFGGGAPGLDVRDCFFDSPYVAGVSVEGKFPDGRWVHDGMGGVLSFTHLDGDHHRANSEATACLLKVSDVFSQINIQSLKAEGQFGGGLIQYKLRGAGSGDIMGGLNINMAEYNCDGIPPTIPKLDTCDFIVVNSDGRRTPSVYISTVNLYGIRYLIRDELTGRKVEPENNYAGNQLTCRLPVQYESFIEDVDEQPRTRYVVGSTALYTFRPPQVPGWYRIMGPVGCHMGGDLIINSTTESSKLSVDVYGGPDPTAAEITILRKTKDPVWPDWVRPCVTQTRAGSYYDPAVSGGRTFLDVYIERSFPGTGKYDKDITFALPLDGRVYPYTGKTQLLWPTNALTSIVPSTNCTLYSCVTNSLIR